MLKYDDTTAEAVDKTPLGIILSLLTSFEVLERYLELELIRSGASLNRFHVMSTLYKNHGEMMPSEIGKGVFRASNTITAVVNTLEKQGLVRRETSPEDGRVKRVVITEKGWKEANNLTPVAQQRSREALSCLDKEQLDALVDIMRTIRNSLLPKIS
jgi:DNA-binding MarR family transcriptional regulator